MTTPAENTALTKAPSDAATANPGLNARKVLIILLGGIGPFVQALGAIRAIREGHRSADITLLTSPEFAEFAKRFPAVDQVDADGIPSNLKERMTLASNIRKANYDITYDLQGDASSKDLFKLLNLPLRSPPVWSGPTLGAAFQFDPSADPGEHPVVRHSRQLMEAGLDAPGIEWPPQPDLSWVRTVLDDSPRLRPEFFGLSGAYVLMFPGHSDTATDRLWPAAAFGDLAKIIAKNGVTPVILGTSADNEAAQEILRIEPKTKSIVARTDLFQIAALAERARYVVGNETGALHLATHAGAPGFVLLREEKDAPIEARMPGGSHVITFKAPDLADMPAETVWQFIRGCGLDRAVNPPSQP